MVVFDLCPLSAVLVSCQETAKLKDHLSPGQTSVHSNIGQGQLFIFMSFRLSREIMTQVINAITRDSQSSIGCAETAIFFGVQIFRVMILPKRITRSR